MAFRITVPPVCWPTWEKNSERYLILDRRLSGEPIAWIFSCHQPGHFRKKVWSPNNRPCLLPHHIMHAQFPHPQRCSQFVFCVAQIRYLLSKLVSRHFFCNGRWRCCSQFSLNIYRNDVQKVSKSTVRSLKRSRSLTEWAVNEGRGLQFQSGVRNQLKILFSQCFVFGISTRRSRFISAITVVCIGVCALCTK